MFWDRGKKNIMRDISDFEILFIYQNSSSTKRNKRMVNTYVDMLLPSGESFNGKVNKDGYIETPLGKVAFLRVKDKYESAGVNALKRTESEAER